MNDVPAESTFQASTARIAYAEWGGRGDPVVFLVHATGFHGRCWDEVVRALPAGLNVIAVDLRGVGDSDIPADDVLELVLPRS